MGSQIDFGQLHEHPLVYKEEHMSHIEGKDGEGSGGKYYCSRCGEVVLAAGPSFSCWECNKFYLHKQCAEAPSNIDHPFHPDHPLVLLPTSPYGEGNRCYCNFCSGKCERFVYHCSACQLDLHIKCALFTVNIAQNKLGELHHIATIDPSSVSFELDHISTHKQLESANCFGCWEPLLESVYLSLDCGFNIHKKCAELPHQIINHPFHTNHPLVLQFNGTDQRRSSCHICKQAPLFRGFIYCCSTCKFVLHIKCAELPSQITHLSHRRHPLLLKPENLPCKACTRKNRFLEFIYCCYLCNFSLHTECAFPPPVVRNRNHPHSFALITRDDSFTCDACGTKGNCVAYLCSECMVMVHRKCTSLPHIIRLLWHTHPHFHSYFLSQGNLKDCEICHDEVNANYGSYYCSICNEIYHVNCALEDKRWYDIIDPQNKDEQQWKPLPDPFIVIERSRDGEVTKMRHFSHVHDLMLSGKCLELDVKFCDGCLHFISTSFYFCSQCDFFLHKACAEMRKETRFFFHACHQPYVLISQGIFRCGICAYDCGGFVYKCYGCGGCICVRCITYSRMRIEGHMHPLVYFYKYKAKCNACGMDTTQVNVFRCKRCDFVLHKTCLTLPLRVRHKCDEHLLALTYGDENDYPESHYCDICEEERNPNHWFYHCAICDNSVHVRCVIGKYSFIKPGSIYREAGHPHPLTFVEKIYYYPECLKCGKPCQDLALECAESGCNYIIHWECRS